MTEDRIFGEVIHSYSRAQAIDDGVLVDVSTVAREAGFRVPVAITRTAWIAYVEVPTEKLKGEGQSEEGRLWDVLWMASLEARRDKNRDHCLFSLRVRLKEGLRRVQLQLHIGPGDNAEPVATIMLPEED